MGRWRALGRRASAVTLAVLSLGGGVAAADELVVTVWSDVGGVSVEVCAEDPETGDPVDVREPEVVGAQLIEVFPQAAPGSLEPGWGCAWLDLEAPRQDLPTGDGYRDLVAVPALQGLGGPQGYDDLSLYVCGPMLEVQVVAEPGAAVVRSGGCVDGRGAELRPDRAARVALTVRATDALLRTTLVAGVGVLALLLATAILIDRYRGSLAVRSWDEPRWLRWSQGVSVGVVAGLAWGALVMMAGPLDVIELRAGFATAFGVLLFGPVVFVSLSIGVTARIERARRHPSVRRLAGRRFLADVPGFDVATDEVPPEVATLPPPPAMAVPDTPWSVLVATYAPAVLLWSAAGVSFVVLDGEGSMALPTAVGLLGAVLGVARARLLRGALPTEEIEPVRRAEILAVLTGCGTVVDEVVQSRVVLPVYDDGSFPPHGLWLGRLLVLGPALGSCPPRRASLLAVVSGTSAHGLWANLTGAVALSVAATLDAWPAPWGWLALLPLLTTITAAGANARRWSGRRGVVDGLDDAEVTALAVEAEWWSLATIAGLADDQGAVEIAHVWPATVLRIEAAAEAAGLPHGRAIAVARDLADRMVDPTRSHPPRG